MTKRLRPGDKPMVEACGPVQINTGENFYIGATRVTYNTAEMEGVVEALFWLRTCVERETVHANSDVLITVDSLYVKGLIDEIYRQRKQSARHAAESHVESDKEKNTTPHSLDAWPLRRCGEQHCRSPCRRWYTLGASASMVATDTVEWRLGRGGLHQKSCEYSERNDSVPGSPPDGRGQQTSQGQTLHRTSLFRHWGR